MRIDSALVDADASNPVVTVARAWQIVERIVRIGVFLNPNEAFTSFLGDCVLILWKFPAAYNLIITWTPDNADRSQIDKWLVIDGLTDKEVATLLKTNLTHSLSEVLFHDKIYD